MTPKVKKYTKETVELALKAIESGEMSVCRASKLFNIPKTSLSDRKNRIYKHESPGNPTKLTKTEEDSLKKWFLKRAKRGLSVNITKLKQKARDILKARVGPAKAALGENWPYRFLKRHPELSRRKPSEVSRASARASESDLREWHQKVTDFLSENDLLQQIEHHPDTIVKVDETSFQLVPTNNELGEKGPKAMFEVANGREKALVTIMFATTAAGKLLPPMMLFKPVSESKRDSIMRNVPESWGVSENPTGYMTGVAMKKYLQWLSEGPLKDVDGQKIIFLDDHSSHKTREVRNFCRKNKIELIAMYANSSRIVQPIGIKVFQPIKTFFSSKMQNWSIEHPDDTFDVALLAPMIDQACKETVREDLIKASFKDSGIFPWNVENIDFSKCQGECRVEAETAPEIKTETSISTNESLQQRLNFHLQQEKLIQKQNDDFALVESSTDGSTTPSTSDLTVTENSLVSLVKLECPKFEVHYPTVEALDCDKCGELFKDKIDLTRHILDKHTKRRLYECFCGAVFTYLPALDEHQELHKDERVTCDICQVYFSTVKFLNRHYEKMHNISLQS